MFLLVSPKKNLAEPEFNVEFIDGQSRSSDFLQSSKATKMQVLCLCRALGIDLIHTLQRCEIKKLMNILRS